MQRWEYTWTKERRKWTYMCSEHRSPSHCSRRHNWTERRSLWAPSCKIDAHLISNINNIRSFIYDRCQCLRTDQKIYGRVLLLQFLLIPAWSIRIHLLHYLPLHCTLWSKWLEIELSAKLIWFEYSPPSEPATPRTPRRCWENPSQTQLSSLLRLLLNKDVHGWQTSKGLPQIC